MSMLSEALYYSNKGWFVFPCREKYGEPFIRNGETIISKEKQPYVSKGLDSATIEETQIKAWWDKWPNAMIGVNCGKSGLFVVDIDRKHVNGLDNFAEWKINDGAGLHSWTPSGGIHIVFSGSGKSSTNGKIGIDTRGEGGYFIVPPSEILEGDNPGKYSKIDDWERVPGVIPDGLMSKLFPDKTYEYDRNPIKDGNEKKQLSRASLNFLANGAVAGERNSTLFKVLADFNGCGYTKDECKEIVLPVCKRINLSDDEFEQVLAHAYSKMRTSAIPDSIQEKLLSGGKNIASKITYDEQSLMENALIACLIMDNQLIPIVYDILNADDFQLLRNRIIFKTISRMYNSSTKVDLITVSNEIDKTTDKIKLDEISKMLTEYFVSPDSVITYAYIIKEKSSIRKVESLMDNKVNYTKSGNLIEILTMIEKDLADIAVYGGAKTTNILNGEQATQFVVERTKAIISGEIIQLPIGFIDYDKYIGGLYPNELVICAGRAGDGKSAMSLSIVNNVGIEQNKGVAFFSLEMSTHESICRLICQLTGIPFRNVFQGKMTKQQWASYEESMQKISNSKIMFDDSSGITIPELRSKIRKLMEKDIKLIVIDQLEQIKGYEGNPTYIQYDKIAYDIKSFTKEFNVPIILNHQLNRGVTDRKLKNPEPELSDLNQAGEKPANQVWAIVHKKDEEGKIIKSKIKILKNRNGPKIDFPVTFIGERMLFVNATHGGEGSSDDDNEPDWTNE